MNNVLITGASGFIGFHLARALVHEAGHVRALVRPTSNVHYIEPLDVEIVRGDLMDVDSLRRAASDRDVVFHLAGLTKALRRASLFAANEQGVRNVLEACDSLSAPPMVVHVSSLAAAGPSRPGRPKVETELPQPVSNYGRSKLAGERVAVEFARRLPISTVRPPIVFGEADVEVLKMFQSLKFSRIHVIPGFARKTFSLIHAADLSRLLLLVAKQGERLTVDSLGTTDSPGTGSGIYFADSGEFPRYIELGAMLSSALGHRLMIPAPVPKAGVWIMAGITELGGRLTGRAPTLSWDKAREATAGSWICSGVKANQQLGFEPACDIATRLDQTVRWYRERGQL